MRRECRERFPRNRRQRKPLFNDPGMHHGTCVTHVPWYIPGLLTPGGGENVPGIAGACVIRNFTYLVRDPCGCVQKRKCGLTMLLTRMLLVWRVFHLFRTRSLFVLMMTHCWLDIFKQTSKYIEINCRTTKFYVFVNNPQQMAYLKACNYLIAVIRW